MHEKKAKNSGQLRKTFFSLLGDNRSRAFLRFVLKRKYKSVPLNFPVDTASVKEILLILPEQHLNVLHQLKNIIALMTLFKHAGITLLCERHVSAYIKMVPGLNIVEYDAHDHYSSEFSSIADEFKNKIDICFLLDENPELPILYLTGATGATVRVGYFDAGDFPFLNLRIRPSPGRVFLSDRFLSMAEVFGSKHGELKWRVAQKTIEEVDHLIKEQKIVPHTALIGFDAVFFLGKFGIELTELLMQRIQGLHLGCIYFIIEHETGRSEMEWIQRQNIPYFSDLSTSRLAALVSKSKLIISGNTPMYALAGLLHRPAAGFFEGEEFARYCPQNARLKGITATGQPDSAVVDQLLAIISSLNVPVGK